MDNFQNSIIAIIKNIEGNGTFSVHNEMNFTHPGLEIDGIGEIGFPVESETAKKIIAVSQKAPFGKGSKTIVDETIRNTWELDPIAFKLNNPDWENFIKKIVAEVRKELGLDDSSVKASLYKLLLYEKNSFFKKHKDSEKEHGMFGTLTVCLPSKFEGGELMVYFDGKEAVIDFSKTSQYKISYAAFYADCEHEIKPITSGFKLSLVYNLILDTSKETIKLKKNSDHVNQLTELLKSNMDEFNSKLKVFLLDHQYTPANFNENTLKLRDKYIVQTLFEAAKNAGYYAKLCLLSHYKMGELETDGEYYEEYQRETSKTTDGAMGEIYEEYSSLENWANDNTPSLGQLGEENIDIINPVIFDEQDPIEEEEEGYTGNAGMTMEYWYHYGAIVVHPLNKINEILTQNSNEEVALKWLNYISENKKLEDLEFIKPFITLLTNSVSNSYKEKPDYSLLATILVKTKSSELFAIASPLLINKFEQINATNWIELTAILNIKHVNEIITKAIERKNANVVDRYLSTLLVSINNAHKISREILTNHLKLVLNSYTTIFDCTSKAETNPIKSKIIEQSILILSELKSDEYDTLFLNAIGPNINRKFAHKIAAPALFNLKNNKFIISKIVTNFCLNELEKSISNKPQPPKDWQRAIPKENKKGEIWNMLIPFLESPTLEKIEYKKAQAYRDLMENAVKQALLDLDTKTIKTGTPHTLLIIKNDASYKKLLKKWTEDCELKRQLQDQ